MAYVDECIKKISKGLYDVNACEESKNKIFNYFMKTSEELEEKRHKRQIKMDDYLFIKGVLMGLAKAYVWSYGEDENYKVMLDEMD